jgi:excisionase family DNA binding protein
MKQQEVEMLLAKVDAAVEASHRAQVELLQAVRLLFVERQAVAKPQPPRERDPDIELAALDEAAFDGLPDEAVFTVEEVAKIFRVGRSAAYDMVRQRQLRSIKIGNQIRIPRRALVAYLRGMDADAFDEFIKRKVEEQEEARPRKR